MFCLDSLIYRLSVQRRIYSESLLRRPECSFLLYSSSETSPVVPGSSSKEKMICSILLLITLTSCVSASLVVNVTQSSYQAEENHNITLEWTFKTRTDGSLSNLNIICEMSINGDRPFSLFHLHEGVELSESQDERFAGRVQFDKDVLREGRLRLHMSRLRTDDSGDYLCTVHTGDGEGSGKCHLNVTERDRPKPETPNTTSGGRDPSPTGSPSQEESPGWIVLYCAVGLIVVAGTLLGVCYCRHRNQQDSMSPSLPRELDPMMTDKHESSLSEVGGPKQRLKVSL